MRIQKIAIKDFRCHQSFSATLDRLNFMVGLNASGKSSIAMAVEFGLTGKAAGFTDARGAGAEDLVRLGSKELSIEMELVNEGVSGVISRTKSTRSHELLLGGRAMPLPDAQRRLYEVLGVSGDVLSACLNSSRFVEMPEKEQKALLAQVLACDPPKIPDSIKEDVRSLGEKPSLWTGEVLDVEGIDLLHKTFYAMRTDTNRDIKMLGTMEAPGEAVADYSEQKQALNELRAELTQAEKSKSAVEERYRLAVSAVDHKRSDLESRKINAENQLLNETELSEFETIIAKSETKQKLAAKIASLEGTVSTKKAKVDRENAAEVARIMQVISHLRATIEEDELVIAALLAIKAACPTCQRALKASEKHDIQEKLAAKLGLLRVDLESSEDELKKANQREYPEEIAQISRDLADQKIALSNIGDVAEAESKLRLHREALVEVGRCDRELKSLSDPELPKVHAFNAAIEELTARIRKGEEVIAGLRDAEQKRAEYKAWGALKSALELRVTTLERLIEFFGPNGVKSQMVGDKIVPFTKAVNDALRAFGYGVRFSLEPYSFQVGAFEREGWRTLRQLSESEQFRFGVAFQIALAMATGLKFVVIDRADILDADSRGELISMLSDSDLEQALVFATNDKPVPEETPEGMKFFELKQREAVTA
jgi:hypothetical protein